MGEDRGPGIVAVARWGASRDVVAAALMLGGAVWAPASAYAQTTPPPPPVAADGRADPVPPAPAADPTSLSPQQSANPVPVAPLPSTASPIVGAPPPAPPPAPPVAPPAEADLYEPALIVDPAAPPPEFDPLLAPVEGDPADALLDPDAPLDVLSGLGVDWPDLSLPLPEVPEPVVLAEEAAPVVLPPELEDGVPSVVADGRFALPAPDGTTAREVLALPGPLPEPVPAPAPVMVADTTRDATLVPDIALAPPPPPPEAPSPSAPTDVAAAGAPFEQDARGLLVVPGLTAAEMAAREVEVPETLGTLPAGADVEQMRGYRVAVRGVEGIADDEFTLRFDELSELEQRDNRDANIAQLRLRATADETLLTTLLRNKGYWDARAVSDIALGADGTRVDVALIATPGPLYTYRAVTLPGLETTGEDAVLYRDFFPVEVGDAVNADVLIASQASLLDGLREDGWAFSELGEELVTIDHDRRDGTLVQPVQPGARYVFGGIDAGRDTLFGARHLQRIARFRPGERYKQSLVEDLRAAVIATGLVSQVDVTTTRSPTDPGAVDIAVATTPAPPRTLAGELGYSTGDGLRASVSWTHRNLFPPEGALTLRGIAGTREQLAAATFRRNNFRGRDRILTIQALASNQDRDAFKAVTAELLASYEQKTTLLFQKPWVWSVGAEVIATSEQPKLADVPRREFYIAALPMSVGYDASDNLLDPQRGFRLAARVSPEFSWAGAAATYARIQLDGSAYYPVREKIVVAGRVRVGTIPGAERTAIAPSRLFYAGGGGSVRGFAYQAVGPRDAANVPLGGKSLTELSLEARIRLDAFGGNFGVVPFIDAGHVSTTTVPRFADFSVGAGVGLRYYSNFGPIRIDVGTPITRRQGDPRVAVYVSLGQAF